MVLSFLFAGLLMRLALLLVAGLGIVTLILASFPPASDWLVSFYVPLLLGGAFGLAVWSVILGIIRRRRDLPASVITSIPSLMFLAAVTIWLWGRLPAGTWIIMLASGAVTLSFILLRSGSFLDPDRDPRG